MAFVTGAGSGIGAATAKRLAAEGACVVCADLDEDNAKSVASDIGGPDAATAVRADVSAEDDVAAALQAAVLAFGGVDLIVNNAGMSISKALLDTTVGDWDRQHAVMARGSFLVSREAARVMVPQAMGGDIIYIVSKNAIFAGPNNVAYGATKADQAHQVRLLAAELGEHGIRVNGVNPDGVVRGSGIFASGWGAQRAAVYGVPEDKLGEYYASRTLLKREVLPEHVANAVFVLASRELSHTTGSARPRRRRGGGGLPAMTAPAPAGPPPLLPAGAGSQMTAPYLHAAIDLGASSARLFAGRLDGGRLVASEVTRLPNGPVRLAGGWHWDILRIHQGMLEGLAQLSRQVDGEPIWAGIDGWGVDYGLLDVTGRLLGAPFHYRDERTSDCVRVSRRGGGAGRVYQATGVQEMKINTLYQLMAERKSAAYAGAARLLLVPDLLAYFLDREGSLRAHQRFDDPTRRRTHGRGRRLDGGRPRATP